MSYNFRKISLFILWCVGLTSCLPNEQTQRQKRDAAKQHMDSLFMPEDTSKTSH